MYIWICIPHMYRICIHLIHVHMNVYMYQYIYISFSIPFHPFLSLFATSHNNKSDRYIHVYVCVCDILTNRYMTLMQRHRKGYCRLWHDCTKCDFRSAWGLVTHCNTLQHTATHCNTLQHTATHCKTLQHAATHCNILRRMSAPSAILEVLEVTWHTVTHCNTLQHITTHCSMLQHTVTRCNTLQHIATHCNIWLHQARF
jgi:hypothetical protein